MGYKLVLDSEKCIACGMCSAVCPTFFEEDVYGYAHIKLNVGYIRNTNNKLTDIIKNCPVHVIKLVRIYD